MFPLKSSLSVKKLSPATKISFQMLLTASTGWVELQEQDAREESSSSSP